MGCLVKNLSAQQTKKILVIEDESSVRCLIHKILNDEGYEVMLAHTGAQGIQIAFEELPDLILCDIILPLLDGYSILNLLSQNPSTSVIPFIFLSAKAERSDWRLGMELGADDYLTKPFTRTDLLKAIATRFTKQEVIRQQYDAVLDQTTEKLNNSIYHDSLTDLPNQLSLQEWFDKRRRLISQNCLINKNNSSEKVEIPILTLSIDRADRLQETLGIQKFDSLLQAIATRLMRCVSNDSTVARLYTTQFAIIIAKQERKSNACLTNSPVLNQQDAAIVAERILNILSLPFRLNAAEIFITVSIGIAVYPKDGHYLELLLKHSLSAMHRVKNTGGNCYQFYSEILLLKSTKSLALESSLRYALERDEFELYYQPKVNMQTMAIVGAEALLRWHHPILGKVSPAEFIPIAEEVGLILPIGQWVLRTACQQAKLWQSDWPSFSVAVNVSAPQFNQPNLSQLIVQALESTSLEPHLLDLELTESALVQNPASAIATLEKFKSLGIQISVDDFGTGYSSLSYLKQFPFDNLKIDQCFVHNLTDEPKNAAITKALIQLAHNLNLKVIAEGVETKAELDFLFQHQCDVVQGYLFSPPVSAATFEALLKQGKCL